MDFSEWLQSELDKRDWTQADLVRASKGKLTTAQVSRVMTRQQNPGVRFCEGIAMALDMSPGDVVHRAGILPTEKKDTDPWLADNQHKLKYIKNPEYRQVISGIIRHFIQEEKNKQK